MHLFSLKSLAVVAALLMSGSVSAQYVWRDATGGKQFSDRPPPPSIPRKDILKAPLSDQRTETETPAESPAPSIETAPLTTAERNADFRKRRMEQADKNKIAADEKAAAAEKKDNCERARSYQRSLEDGMRISSTSRSGERFTMNDEQRDIEIRNVRKLVSDCR